MLVKSMNRDEILYILNNFDKETLEKLCEKARAIRDKHYGNRVFVRGLIEFSSYCKQDCFYCGLRKSNRKADRYRLTKEEILQCCLTGYNLGFRTFVLQSGEDDFFTKDIMCDIISEIKGNFKEAALTLSMGEKSFDEYEAYYKAGADRYLLRHETSDDAHYGKLHPQNLSLESRKQCLLSLQKIGFQVGAGFMVGSPFQTVENLADDLMFLKNLNPHMVGIGPFIPHGETPFKNRIQGDLDTVLLCLAITRILLPKVLLPSTTALSTIAENGRELGFMASANVIMPNLSPLNVRGQYLLYNKSSFKTEVAEDVKILRRKAENTGMVFDYSRADHMDWSR